MTPWVRCAYHFAGHEPDADLMQAKVRLGRRDFSRRFHRMPRMAERTCMFENNICSQIFQANRIRCSRQRPVTSFLGCICKWLRSSMVPPNCRWQRCPELFICSRQISRDSSESGVHTAPWVRSCSGRCEIELPDSEQVRVSDTRHNLLDRF